MIEFIFATHNSHKVSEVLDILGHSQLIIRSLKEIQYDEEIEETGKTLEENAQIKAQTIHNLLKTNTIAEDTGLEVFALDMKPGVYSARYAGDHRNSDENIDLLLKNMQGKKDRRAQFRTVLALWYDNEEHLFEGIVTGQITQERRGKGGFGYDPVFIPDGYDKTFGELPSEVKNTISHRARAVEAMKEYIDSHVLP